MNSKVLISDEAKKLGLKTSYAIISGVKIKKSDPELEKLKNQVNIVRTERIEAMRKAYKSFNVDPSRRTPSAEALIERLEQGKSIYTINTLVDVYNLSSVKENLPMAAYDLGKVVWPIVLREAKEGEIITLIGGKVKKTKKGEMVYADKEKIVCLDFNYRDCDETKITEKTRDVIVFVDGCEEIKDQDVLDSLDRTCGLIIRFNGGKVIEKMIVK